MSAAAASLRRSSAVRRSKGGIEKSSATGMEGTIPLSLRDGSGEGAADESHSARFCLPQGEGACNRRQYLCTEALTGCGSDWQPLHQGASERTMSTEAMKSRSRRQGERIPWTSDCKAS